MGPDSVGVAAGIASPAEKEPGEIFKEAIAVQGSLNSPSVGPSVRADAQNMLGLPAQAGAQDIPILSAPQNQQCTENSTQAKGDEPLSHVLGNIPILSGNGTLGSRHRSGPRTHVLAVYMNSISDVLTFPLRVERFFRSLFGRSVSPAMKLPRPFRVGRFE
ncbi:rodlin [Streptomyces sp. NPDC058122]|uniref:rodlin n=1 Tax=Streptomyces sp. NPDC058122 TaxID=3346349 RepID=UPI0036E81C1E